MFKIKRNVKRSTGDFCDLNSFDTKESHNSDVVKRSCIAHIYAQVNRSFSYRALLPNPIGICICESGNNKRILSGRTRIDCWPSHASVYAFIYLKLIINFKDGHRKL